MKFITASKVTANTKVKSLAAVAHRPEVYSVTISGNKKPSNEENEPFLSPHYYITLKDAEVQHSCECMSQSFLCKGIKSCSLSNGYKAPFKTNNCGRAESVVIKSLKPL